MNWKRLLVGEWNWTRPFWCLGLVYLALASIAWLFGDRFIFHPPLRTYAPSSDNLELFPSASGQELAAFWYPPASPEDPVLLWTHGNAEDIGTLRPLHREIAAAGFGLFAYDYPGYGLSEGTPTEKSCYEAQAAAYAHLTGKLAIDPSRIVIVGQSVGSGPACWLAEREEAAGLILISPFLSAFRTLAPVTLFPGDRFPNHKRIADIAEPLLVIHGTQDQIIAFSHGQTLHDKHPGPKELLPIGGAGHNNIWNRGGREIVSTMQRFAQRYSGSTPKNSSSTAR